MVRNNKNKWLKEKKGKQYGMDSKSIAINRIKNGFKFEQIER
jgi:hypothetical protein